MTMFATGRRTGVHACLALCCVLDSHQGPPLRLCHGISFVAKHPRALGNALALGLAADAVYTLLCTSRTRCVQL